MCMVIEAQLFTILLGTLLLWIGINTLTMTLQGRYFLALGFGVGKSMEPTIPRGVTLQIDYYPHSIEEGDIVSFQSDYGSICHRVVEIDGDSVRFKGDNNRFDDGWFSKSVITSKVLQVRGYIVYVPLSPAAVRATIEKWRRSKTLK